MVVGREAELTTLRCALDDASEGHARRILLVGDPGIGCTTLLRTTADSGRDLGFTVLAVACPEEAGDVRYGLIDDLVHCHPDLLRHLAPADAALLSELTVRAAPGPSRIATAFLHLLTAADRTGPVLVAVDDLHKADPDSMAALTIAAGRLLGRRVAVVATASRQHSGDPRLTPWDLLEVGPLDPESAVRVLREAVSPLVRDGMSDAAAQALVEQLGRNPTALRESPRILTDDELCGRAPLPDPLPVGERLLAGWRNVFSDLTAAQQDAVLIWLLTAAPSHELFTTVLHRAGASPEDQMAGRLALGGLAPEQGGPAAASSALLRSAIISCAGRDRVQGIHALAARCAEELSLPPATVIGHLARGAEHVDDVVRRLEVQAERAIQRGQTATAARALQVAAGLAGTTERRARLAARAARLRVGTSGGPEGTGPLLDILATASLSPQEQIWADWLRAEHLAAADLYESLGWTVTAAHRARDADPDLVPPIALAGSFRAWAVGDGGSALGLADLLLEHEANREAALAGAVGQPAAPPWAGRALRGVARFQVAEVSAAEEDLAAARAMSAAWELTPDVPLPLLVNVVLLDEVMVTGRRFADPRLVMALQRVEGETGESLGILRNVQAARALRRGDLTIARGLVDEGLELARAQGSAHDILLRLCTAVRLDALVGDTDALGTELADLRRIASLLGHELGRAYADRAEGLLGLAELRHVDAVAALLPLTDQLLLGMAPTDPVLMGRADLVEALVGSGDMSGATAVQDELALLLSESSDVRAQALLARSGSLLATGHDAVFGLRRAVELWQTSEEAFEVARTRLMLGETLLAQGRDDPATLELRAAARAFGLMGAHPWLARTRAALARTAPPDPRRPLQLDPTVQLTAAELRVALEVADGSTNKEIAHRLSLSPRTVEHHLAVAYRKLGVRSRTALVARLSGGGTPPTDPPS